MAQAIKKCLLVAKAGQAQSLCPVLVAWLQEQGVSATCLAVDDPKLSFLAPMQDLVLVLGGDGTLVGLGRKLMEYGVPILGINFGQVGFLAEISASNWQQEMMSILAGEFRIVQRLGLSWSLQRKTEIVAQGQAVNDLVLGRGALARIVSVGIKIDEEDLGWVRADGIIVSTPLGTSAYALSAHGALLQPELDALALTPISPFFKSFPPLILAGSSLITLQAGSSETFLTIDGQEGFNLQKQDELKVWGKPGLKMLIPSHSSYFKRLRERGFISTPVQGA